MYCSSIDECTIGTGAGSLVGLATGSSVVGLGVESVAGSGVGSGGVVCDSVGIMLVWAMGLDVVGGYVGMMDGADWAMGLDVGGVYVGMMEDAGWAMGLDVVGGYVGMTEAFAVGFDVGVAPAEGNGIFDGENVGISVMMVGSVCGERIWHRKKSESYSQIRVRL
jgi:hypothetical protein